jgi:MFS family permease
MKNPVPSDNRLWTKDFILTSLSNFFIFFSFHLLTPTLPVFVIERGGDKLEAGLAVGIFTVTALLVRPFAGHALDLIGSKKVLLFGLIVFTVSIISYNWVISVSFILIIRSIQGVGWGVASTTYATMISNQIVAERRSEGMGYFGLSINLGMACAPLLGLWMMVNYGFTAVFFIATLSILISMVLSKFIDFPPMTVKTTQVENSTFIEKSSIVPALLVMLMTLSHGGILSSLTLFGLEAGIANVGWFFLSSAIIMMITRSITGKIADRKGRVYILLPGGIVFSLGLLLISLSSNVVTLIVAAIFYGMGFGAIQPTLQAWTISRAHPRRRGIATATYFSAFDLGVGVGAFLAGLLSKWMEYAVIYQISIAFMLIFGLYYTAFFIREKNGTHHLFKIKIGKRGVK